MSDSEAAEAKLSEAMRRLNEVETQSWDGYGASGSYERAVAMNRARLHAHTAIVDALLDLQAAGGGPGPQAVQAGIDMWRAEIAHDKRNLVKYGGIPH